MNNTSKKPRKTSSSAEQLAACSLISGIAGIICSLFYLPFSLVSGKNTPMGLICGVIGIVLAIMAKNADIRPGKKYPGKALAGFIFSVIAIALTMFFFYSLINYYDLLRDPVKGPQINQLIYQMQQQLQMQMHRQTSLFHKINIEHAKSHSLVFILREWLLLFYLFIY